MEISGCSVVVTGAARGIGKAIATSLARRGASLCLLDVLAGELTGTAQELAREGGRVLPIGADITDAEAVEAAFERSERELGPTGVLVNNAATFSVIGPVWEVDPELWFRDIRVNLYGAFLCSRAALKRMVPRGRGYLVNMVSEGGLSDPHPYSTSYACSKTGLMRLTEAIAKEGEPHGITALAVAPPAVLTDMTRFIMEDPGGRKWRPSFERLFAEHHDRPAAEIGEFVAELLHSDCEALSGRFIPCTAALESLRADARRIVEEDLLTLRIRR
jgi:NAD(P)-dependent dehydrogenase (short-subunit alcohol dehydrogenase family)